MGAMQSPMVDDTEQLSTIRTSSTSWLEELLDICAAIRSFPSSPPSNTRSVRRSILKHRGTRSPTTFENEIASYPVHSRANLENASDQQPQLKDVETLMETVIISSYDGHGTYLPTSWSSSKRHFPHAGALHSMLGVQHNFGECIQSGSLDWASPQPLLQRTHEVLGFPHYPASHVSFYASSLQCLVSGVLVVSWIVQSMRKTRRGRKQMLGRRNNCISMPLLFGSCLIFFIPGTLAWNGRACPTMPVSVTDLWKALAWFATAQHWTGALMAGLNLSLPVTEWEPSLRLPSTGQYILFAAWGISWVWYVFLHYRRLLVAQTEAEAQAQTHPQTRRRTTSALKPAGNFLLLLSAGILCAITMHLTVRRLESTGKDFFIVMSLVATVTALLLSITWQDKDLEAARDSGGDIELGNNPPGVLSGINLPIGTLAGTSS